MKFDGNIGTGLRSNWTLDNYNSTIHLISRLLDWLNTLKHKDVEKLFFFVRLQKWLLFQSLFSVENSKLTSQ